MSRRFKNWATTADYECALHGPGCVPVIAWGYFTTLYLCADAWADIQEGMESHV